MSGGLWRSLALSVVMAFAAGAPAATKSGAAASAAQPATPASPVADSGPTEFGGELEAGRTYLAEVMYDPNALRIWRPVKDVQVPKNSAWTIEWVNLAKFPVLASAAVRAKPQRFRFKVIKTDVSSGAPDMPWTMIYRCEIQAVAAVAAPAGKKR